MFLFNDNKDVREIRGFEEFRVSCNPSVKDFDGVFDDIEDKVEEEHVPSLSLLVTLMVNIRLVEDDKLRSKLYEYLVEELVFYIVSMYGTEGNEECYDK